MSAHSRSAAHRNPRSIFIRFGLSPKDFHSLRLIPVAFSFASAVSVQVGFVTISHQRLPCTIIVRFRYMYQFAPESCGFGTNHCSSFETFAFAIWVVPMCAAFGVDSCCLKVLTTCTLGTHLCTFGLFACAKTHTMHSNCTLSTVSWQFSFSPSLVCFSMDSGRPFESNVRQECSEHVVVF